MKNIGLVLEGGGMKGLYTAGVLEYFMEKNLFFPYVVGVSAGACMGATYLSRQQGRNKKVNTELVSDYRYISYRNLIRKRELFGMDFLFDEVPNKIVPFDFQTFLNCNEQFVIGTTDCESGQAVYYNKKEHGNDILKIIRASSSVPFIAPAVEYNNRKLLDGGIIDPIPVLKAQTDGYEKNVVIMTKPEGYEKQRNKFSGLAKILYRKYPKIAENLVDHYRFYNETISYMNQEEQKDNFYVIQPSVQLPISGIERNKEKLVNLYNLGYIDVQYHLYKPFPNCDIRKIRKDFNNTFTEDDCISADLNYYWMHTAGTLSYVLNNNEQEIMNYPILYRDFINYEKTRKLLLYYLTE